MYRLLKQLLALVIAVLMTTTALPVLAETENTAFTQWNAKAQYLFHLGVATASSSADDSNYSNFRYIAQEFVPFKPFVNGAQIGLNLTAGTAVMHIEIRKEDANSDPIYTTEIPFASKGNGDYLYEFGFDRTVEVVPYEPYYLVYYLASKSSATNACIVIGENLAPNPAQHPMYGWQMSNDDIHFSMTKSLVSWFRVIQRDGMDVQVCHNDSAANVTVHSDLKNGGITTVATEGAGAVKGYYNSAVGTKGKANISLGIWGGADVSGATYMSFDVYIQGLTVTGASGVRFGGTSFSSWSDKSYGSVPCPAMGTITNGWNHIVVELPDTATWTTLYNIWFAWDEADCITVNSTDNMLAIDDVRFLDEKGKAINEIRNSAKDLVESINQLPAPENMADEDAGTVRQLQEQFNALDPDMQDLVTNADTLMAAVQQLEIVDTVINLIDAIGAVHTYSGIGINAARTAYDALPESKKAQISNYDILLAAEKAFASLQEVIVPEDMKNGKPSVSNDPVAWQISTCNTLSTLSMSGVSEVNEITADDGEQYLAFIGNGAGTVIITPSTQTQFPFSITDYGAEELALRLQLYVSDASAFETSGQLEITSSGNSDSQELHWLTSDIDLQDGWNTLYLPFSDGGNTGGTLDITNINYARFYLFPSQDVIMAIDDIKIVTVAEPAMNEDFSETACLSKWEGTATLSLKDGALQMSGSGEVTVTSSAYYLGMAYPDRCPIDLQLLTDRADGISDLVLTLTDSTGKTAVSTLETALLVSGEWSRYQVVPSEMTAEAGFNSEAIHSIALSATLHDATLWLDHIRCTMRSGEHWRDWMYEYTAEPGDFSIAVIPDIQELTAAHPDKLNTIMNWIADNKETENIQFAIDVGDVTWNGHSGNHEEFQTAANAFQILQDAGVDYSISYGNHDYTHGTSRDTTLFNQYFPLSNVSTFDSYGGVMTEGKIDNMYYCFQVQGIRYMVVVLEFSPTEEALAWANEVIAAHSDYNVIISTHSYMDFIYGERSATGETVWKNLASKHENIFMVVCGHECITDDPGSMNYREDRGEKGNTVYQVMANSQDIDATRGGVGLLLMMRFTDGGRTIDFNYFSPVNDGLAYKEVNQFSVTLPEGQLITADYTLTFNTDGGSTVATRYLNEGQPLDEAIADPVKEGYTFSGWYNGNTKVELADFTMPANNVTLIARWMQNTAPVTPSYGDVNGDDAVDAKDALLILQAAVDKVTLTDEQTVKADVNGDKAIDAKDALLVLQKAVDKIDKFPVE